MRSLIYLFIGVVFGIVMIKSEAASWFRIYEMFTFESFHMYGIIGTALLTGLIFIQIIKKKQVNDIDGSPIILANKDKSFARYGIGGIFFGLGWALVGACPGPMFALLGAGFIPIGIVIFGALIGTWLYGLLKDKLPH